jgi:protein SCO1
MDKPEADWSTTQGRIHVASGIRISKCTDPQTGTPGGYRLRSFHCPQPPVFLRVLRALCGECFGGVFWCVPLRIPSFALALAILLAAPLAHAQYAADRPVGASAQQAPAWQKNAGIDQNLGRPLPLSDSWTDATGRTVRLGDFFNDGRPVMLELMYYNCQMLCPQVLHGMATALRESGFHAGNQYDVIVASIDPSDKPSDAAAKKQQFLSMIDQSSAGSSVHFLTGPQTSITDLAQATGFHYVRVPGPDGKMDQFAHSSVIMIATPDGRLSKYLFGVDYQSRDVRLAIIQASTRHIGSFSDLVLLYCCSYSPSQGRYTVAVLRILGLAGVGSLLAVLLMVYLLSKKPKNTLVGV